jgi:hypothetical protein
MAGYLSSCYHAELDNFCDVGLCCHLNSLRRSTYLVHARIPHLHRQEVTRESMLNYNELLRYQLVAIAASDKHKCKKCHDDSCLLYE